MVWRYGEISDFVAAFCCCIGVKYQVLHDIGGWKMRRTVARAVHRVLMARVVVLAFAAFVFNTTEFIPVALLSDIAAGFSIPVERAGLMITLYAWIVTLMSLPFMLLTAKMERRSLLMKLFVLFIASHVLTAFAWNFGVLLIARAGVALSHAVFWSITASLAVRVAPKDKKMQALGLLAMGSSLAMVLGLPIGRVIGQYLGWRATFAIIGMAAAVAMVLLWRLLPPLPSKNSGSLKSVPLLFKRPLLVGLFVLTAIVVSAHFTAYSYVEPFVREIGGFSEGAATAILLVFGLAGLTGSVLFNLYHRKNPSLFLQLSVGSLLASLVLMLPLSHYAAVMYVLVFVWGVGIAGIGLGLQVRVLQLAPDATDVAMAIYSGIFNIGIGGGALIGNLAIKHFGLADVGLTGAALAAVSMVLLLWLSRRYGAPAGLKQ